MICLICSVAYGQTVTRTLVQGSFEDENTWRFAETNGEVTFYWQFRDARYRNIYEFGGILIGSQEGLNDLIKKLEYMGNQPNGVEIKYAPLSLLPEIKDIYVHDDGAYTTISKTRALKFANELKTKTHLLLSIHSNHVGSSAFELDKMMMGSYDDDAKAFANRALIAAGLTPLEK